jgi:hypothetical protein
MTSGVTTVVSRHVTRALTPDAVTPDPTAGAAATFR